MYNGIGLSSVRGTATSGHVQQNAGHVRNSRRHRSRTAGVFDSARHNRQERAPLLTAEAIRDGQSSLALHEKKRQLEVRLLELRDRLEERGWGDIEIEREIARERTGTMDRWASEEEQARLVRKEHENETSEERADLAVDDSEKQTETRGVRDHPPNYDRGRFRDHRYSDPRRRGGRGGKNAQQQGMFQEERNERLRDAFGISKTHHKEGAAFDRELIEAKRREKQQREEQNAKAKRKIERQKIRQEREEARSKRREEKKRERESGNRNDVPRRRRRSTSRSESSRSSYSSSSSSYSSRSSSSSSFSSRSRSRGRRNKRSRSYSSSSSSSNSRSSSRDHSHRRNKKQSKRRDSHSSESDRPSFKGKPSKSPSRDRSNERSD